MRAVKSISVVQVKYHGSADCHVSLEAVPGDAQDVYIQCGERNIVRPVDGNGDWPHMVHFGANEIFASFPVYGYNIGEATLFACKYGEHDCDIDNATKSNVAYVTSSTLIIGQAIPITITVSPSQDDGTALLLSTQAGLADGEQFTCTVVFDRLVTGDEPDSIVVLDVNNRDVILPPPNADGSASAWPYAMKFDPNSRTATVTLTASTSTLAADAQVQIFAANYQQKNPHKPAIMLTTVSVQK